MLTPAQYVIGKFGGLTGTSKAISVPITTVQGWAERGRIPQNHWKALIHAAKANDKLLTFEDFLTDHPEPAHAGQAA
jgi:hypothetical protein